MAIENSCVSNPVNSLFHLVLRIPYVMVCFVLRSMLCGIVANFPNRIAVQMDFLKFIWCVYSFCIYTGVNHLPSLSIQSEVEHYV